MPLCVFFLPLCDEVAVPDFPSMQERQSGLLLEVGVQGVDQPEGSIHLPQQQGPAIGGQLAALEIRSDVLAFEA
jgi:hypothetical protein